MVTKWTATFLIALSGLRLAAQADTLSVVSPDGALKFGLTTGAPGNKPLFQVNYRNALIIDHSALGLIFAGGDTLGINQKIIDQKRGHQNQTWKTIIGENAIVTDNYNSLLVTLVNANTDKDTLRLEIRAYNEGIAFRYNIPERTNTKIIKELTHFRFVKNGTTWVSNKAQTEIVKKDFNSIGFICDRPLLGELDSKTYFALGEAALVDFSRMKFETKAAFPNTFFATIEDTIHFTGAFSSPWRYVMVAQTPGRLLENNYMLLNLNEPNQISNTSFIKPGKVIRDITLSTGNAIACIDFAAKNGLEYVLFDAGWYGNQWDTAADASAPYLDPTKSTGPFDFDSIRAYSQKKGIGIILYVNQIALHFQIDKILPIYKQWGIKGIKFGFVDVGKQRVTSEMHQWIRKCAEYGLIVDIHDEYRPTGYSRTYPNLLTCEGIGGDETSATNSMAINSIFTRSIAGPADQTNVYLSDRVDQMGSHASQLAKTICIYSPLQFLFWYDVPALINDIPELKFFGALPTTWDESHVLEGYPGRYVCMARRSGKNWFIAAFNGNENKDYSIPLTFLEAGQTYLATYYTDNGTLNTPTHVAIDAQLVTNKSIIARRVLATDGIAVHIRQLSKDESSKPYLEIISPKADVRFNKGFNLQAEAIALDLQGIKEVSLYINNIFVRKILAAPYQWGFTGQTDPLLKDMAPGTYVLKFEAVNNSNVVSRDSTKVKIDNYGNAALNRPASQSSNNYTDKGFAAKAVDGNTDGSTAANTFNHTTNELNAWWQMDLQAVKQIGAIHIWNRSTVSGRLSNFIVFVSETPFSSTSPALTKSQSGVWAYEVPGTAGRPTIIPCGQSGRYIRVQLLGTNFLHMAEVEVMVQLPDIPISIAGKDTTTNEGNMVWLNGLASFDKNGLPLSYTWMGPIALTNAASAKPGFMAPEIAKDTVFQFILIVNNGLSKSQPSFTTVKVLNTPKIPVAVAGKDHTVNSGDVVELRGTESFCPDGGQISSYKWEPLENIELLNKSQASCFFIAPEVSRDTIYGFVLTVAQNSVFSKPDTVMVKVKKSAQASLALLGSSNNFLLFPNPLKGGSAYVSAASASPVYDIAVKDISGKTIFSIAKKTGMTELPPGIFRGKGIYLIEIYSNNQLKVHKLIVF